MRVVSSRNFYHCKKRNEQSKKNDDGNKNKEGSKDFPDHLKNKNEYLPDCFKYSSDHCSRFPGSAFADFIHSSFQDFHFFLHILLDVGNGNRLPFHLQL